MELLEGPAVSPDHEYGEPPDLDAAYRTLDRTLGSITMADNKALIALTFEGAVVAGLIVVADTLKSISGRPIDLWAATVLGALLVFFACLCYSVLKLFQTISPRIAPPKSEDHVSELFYFAGIARLPREEFADRMRHLTADEIHEAVVTITHTNARIAGNKFRNLRDAFRGLGLQIVLYVLVVLLTVLPGHQ